MTKNDLEIQAEALGQWLLANKLFLATAESCTGGWIAQTITSVAGSSKWFDRGFVCYSNEAKNEMLDVPPDLIKTYGAVSKEVAEALAKGALANSHAQVSISVTGIAGPDGGSAQKPVGTVWFGFAYFINEEVLLKSCRQLFNGDRESIRKQAVQFALNWTFNELKN